MSLEWAVTSVSDACRQAWFWRPTRWESAGSSGPAGGNRRSTRRPGQRPLRRIAKNKQRRPGSTHVK